MKAKDNAKFIIITKVYSIAVAELRTKKQVKEWVESQTRYSWDDLKILSGKITETYLPLF